MLPSHNARTTEAGTVKKLGVAPLGVLATVRHDSLHNTIHGPIQFMSVRLLRYDQTK
jgi:hypothetical protein